MRVRAKRLGGWCGTTEGKLFLALLAAALGIRLVLAPYHGFLGDNQIDVTWGFDLDHHFFHVYSTIGFYNDPLVYPPFMVYLFGLMDGIYTLLVRLTGGHPSFDVYQSPLVNVLIKLPSLLADLGVVSLVYWLTRQVRSERWAFVAAATYAISPAILFDGALWGQTDGIVYVVVLLGLLCTLKQRGLWAGILCGLALMLKPQPAIFIPFVLVYLQRWGGRREFKRAVIGMAGSIAVICLPYLLPPLPEIFYYLANVGGWSYNGHSSVGGYNLWWLVNIPRGEAPPHWGLIVTFTIGMALFALVYVLVSKGIRRSPTPQTFWLGAAIVALAFFALTTLQHERYLYPALALLLVAAVYDTRLYVLYAVASITVFLNMAIPVLLYDSKLYQEVPQLRDTFTPNDQAPGWLQNGLALVQVALFLCALAIFLLNLRRLAAPAPDTEKTPALVLASEEVPTSIHQRGV